MLRIIVLFVLSFYATSGHPAEEIAKLTANDGAANDKLGWSVAINGDTAVAGAFFHDHQGNDSGAAYVYVRNGDTWTQQAELLPSDGAAGDQAGFGQVAIDGDTVLLGALSHDNEQIDSGAVYVFVRNGSSWTEQAKLLAIDREEGDQFGVGVALSGDTAVVGANGDDHPDGSQGSIYIFVRNGDVWTQQAKLTGDPALDVNHPGFAAANIVINGDTVVVGAPTTDPQGTDSGTTYVFVRNGNVWTKQAQLMASDGVAQDQFGSFNALDGDTLLIGASAGHSTSAPGKVYVFTRNVGAWTEQTTLVADDAIAADLFGRVALVGNTAVISASEDDDQGENSGSAYVFIGTGPTWSQQTKILPGDGAAIDNFGVTVAMDGETIIFGAWRDDDQGTNSGSAYIFDETGQAIIGDWPAAVHDSTSVQSGSNVVITVLANDRALTDVPLVVGLKTSPENGSAIVAADNRITYTPAPGFAGAESFAYEVVDRDGDASIASVRVTVTGAGNTGGADSIGGGGGGGGSFGLDLASLTLLTGLTLFMAWRRKIR